jgi:hypothetical protein
MHKQLLLKAYDVTKLHGDAYMLTLTPEQLTTLHEDLGILMQEAGSSQEELQIARKFFFEQEGYMETDIKCWQYWKERTDD